MKTELAAAMTSDTPHRTDIAADSRRNLSSESHSFWCVFRVVRRCIVFVLVIAIAGLGGGQKALAQFSDDPKKNKDYWFREGMRDLERLQQAERDYFKEMCITGTPEYAQGNPDLLEKQKSYEKAKANFEADAEHYAENTDEVRAAKAVYEAARKAADDFVPRHDVFEQPGEFEAKLAHAKQLEQAAAAAKAKLETVRREEKNSAIGSMKNESLLNLFEKFVGFFVDVIANACPLPSGTDFSGLWVGLGAGGGLNDPSPDQLALGTGLPRQERRGDLPFTRDDKLRELYDAVANPELAAIFAAASPRGLGRIGAMASMHVGYGLSLGRVVLGPELSVQFGSASEVSTPLFPVAAFSPAQPGSVTTFQFNSPTGFVHATSGPAYGAALRLGVPIGGPSSPPMMPYLRAGMRVQQTTFEANPLALTGASAAAGLLTRHTETIVSPVVGVGFEVKVGEVPRGGRITVGAEFNHVFQDAGRVPLGVAELAGGVPKPAYLPNPHDSGNEAKVTLKAYLQ